MRVIAGECKGRNLKTLPGSHTRPTSEKVKEAMFSIIQFDLEGRSVLDLFAGSGQLGIEALSRGADRCVFVENDRGALAIVKENIERCHFEDRSKAVLSDYTAYIKHTGDKFDIIIIDPPYSGFDTQKALDLIGKFDISNFNAIIIVESEVSSSISEIPGFVKGKDYRYGHTKLTLFRRS